VRAAAAVGEVPAVIVVVFLRGRPGQRVTVGVGCGVCGTLVGGCSRGFSVGGVDEGEALDEVLGTRLTAFWFWAIDVEGGGWRSWGTGWGWFGWSYGGVDDGVVCGREDVTKTTTLVEDWIQGASVYGLLDSAGHLIALPVQVCDVLGAEVVAGGARVLPHGRSVFASGGPDRNFGLVVVP
jgi:hypothetical protein